MRHPCTKARRGSNGFTARGRVLAALAARGFGRRAPRKRGAREAWSVQSRPADVRTGRWEGQGSPPERAEPDLPRDALGPWPRDFGASRPRINRGFGALSASARHPGFSPGRARPPPGCRAARPCRAGDREAATPETPPCEDGLSAASARPDVAAVPSHRPSASASARSRRRLDRKAMPPHFRTPPEAPLAGRTIQLIVLVGIVVKQLFPHVSPENM